MSAFGLPLADFCTGCCRFYATLPRCRLRVACFSTVASLAPGGFAGLRTCARLSGLRARGAVGPPLGCAVLGCVVLGFAHSCSGLCAARSGLRLGCALGAGPRAALLAFAARFVALGCCALLTGCATARFRPLGCACDRRALGCGLRRLAGSLGYASCALALAGADFCLPLGCAIGALPLGCASLRFAHLVALLALGVGRG